MSGCCLITGGTGYIGRHLSKALSNAGTRVIVVSRNAQQHQQHFADAQQVVLIDAANIVETIAKAADGAAVTSMIHLAADTSAVNTSTAALNQVASNVGAPTGIIEACLPHGLQQIINTGSFWQYATGTPEQIPNSLYAATKSAFEAVLEHYRYNHGLRVLTIELYDVYGPNDPRPKLLNLLTSTNSIELDMTRGEQQIAPIHIDDAVTAYTTALAWLSGQENGSRHRFSARSEHAVTLKKLIETLGEVCQASGSQRLPTINWGAKPYRKEEVFTLKPANPVPGWRPKLSLAQGLETLLQTTAMGNAP